MLAFNIFKLIGELFQILFIPFKALRLHIARQDAGWWTSNAINWIFVLILILLLSYWIGQSLKFKREGTEDKA